MDMSQARLKQRQGLEPSQRRVRHIQCVLARNLTFTQNANQRTLASVLYHQLSPHYHQYDNSHFSHSAVSSVSNNNHNTVNNFSGSYHQLPHQHHNRSITPSLDLPSGASSPTRSYFRSPWKNYQYGFQKSKGPGSDAGSTISASESGRGASSVIKEPIARLSAGIKATVFSAGHSFESGYTSETGSGAGGLSSSSKTKSRYRASADLSVSRPSSNDGQRHNQKQQLQPQQQPQGGEDQSTSGRFSREWSSVPSTPPPAASASARDRYLVPSNINIEPRGTKDSRKQSANASSPSMRDQSGQSDTETEVVDPRLPPFATRSKGGSPSSSSPSSPILLDTYFTFHDPTNDNVIYTSETVMCSNNPKYSPLEDHLFTDSTKRRSSHVIIRIWAGYCEKSRSGSGSKAEADYFLLLEWRVDLCCLRFIGKELRDLPTSLPNNMIVFGFQDGFYTAPDEDDMMEHAAHGSSLEAIGMAQGPGGLGAGVSPSYTYESVMRLNNLHECIADTKKSRDEIKHNIEVALNKENAPMLMQKRRGECTERLWHLQRQVGHELNILEEAQDKAAALRQEHIERRKAITESRERGETQEMYLEENWTNLANNKDSLFHTLKEYSTKRTELIATLFTIFPITESETNPNLLQICKVPLPNSVYVGLDEEAIAIGLGFACHLVIMLAHYLSVPLRYPLTPMGSKAFVLDPVSLLVGPKEFPLFGKGQERHRFEYGVFLLNKNIEQLMNSQGLQFMDLRQTLPNLRYLMETLLTSSPSQSTLYRSKFISQKKQDRLEQDRLSDLFIMSLEPREFDHALKAEGENNSTGNSDNNQGADDGLADGSEKRLHNRSPSSTKGNGNNHHNNNYSSERSSLVREYDPIEGDYMLVLDNSSARSSPRPRSRKETGESDISSSLSMATVERTVGPRITLMSASPRAEVIGSGSGGEGGHQRVSSGSSGLLHHQQQQFHQQNHQGHASSASSSLSGTEDEEDRRSVDDPAFRDWVSEVAAAVSDEENERVRQFTSEMRPGGPLTTGREADILVDSKMGSDLHNTGFDLTLERSSSAASDITGSESGAESISSCHSPSGEKQQHQHQHQHEGQQDHAYVGSPVVTSADSPPSRTGTNITTSPAAFKNFSGGTFSRDSEGETDVDDAIRSRSASRSPPLPPVASTAMFSKEHSRLQAGERWISTQGPRPMSGGHQQEPEEDEDDDQTPSRSPDTIVTTSNNLINTTANQRGRRLSDKFGGTGGITAGNKDCDHGRDQTTATSKERILRHRPGAEVQLSPPAVVATSGILEAGG